MSEIKKTIKPSGQGGDYTSLETCLNANEQDLETGGNYFLASIEGTWTIDDTANVLIDGWVTAENNNIRIIANSEARHDGTVGSGYRLVPTSSGNCITVKENYTFFEGLELKCPGLATSDECFRLEATETLITKCIIWTKSTADDCDGVYMGLFSGDVSIDNCVVYGFARAGLHPQPYSGTYTQNWLVRNCTIMKCGKSGELESGAICIRRIATSSVTVTVSNTIGMDTLSTFDDFAFTNDAVYADYQGDYNISSDTSSPGVNSLDNRTSTDNVNPGAGNWVIFVNIKSNDENYHLQNVAENDALNAGISSGMPTDDIDWETRTGTWDIGADEYVSEVKLKTSIIFID